jgi:hypothetical protein
VSGVRTRQVIRQSLWGSIAFALLAALYGAPAASATPQTLASVTVRAPIAAYGGWVLWSAPVSGGWGLDAYHAGKTTALRVTPRPQPFDLDLGTDRAGGVVATFSRCAHTPGYSEGDALFQELNGTGCRVHVLNLATYRESTPAIPHPADTSDTTPSMWNGNIAFARFDPRHHRNIAQVLLWSGQTHRLRALRHGAVPTKCPIVKGGVLTGGELDGPGAICTGAIEGMDLGPKLVTFLWKIDGPEVFGTGGGWEVRADRLDTGASILVGTGDASEACMGPGSIESSIPSSPSVEGERVWYSQMVSSCYVNTVSVRRFNTHTNHRYSAPMTGEVLQMIREGSTLVALVAPPPKGGVDPDCTPAEPCSIERLQAPALKLESRLPQSPFA